ncbi:MAG TPA: pro-sigmaK processing inhibitor BofA family protein [Candidatus Mediterraneibacter faecavium]|uniref:Pro-sigmaK processing inhibitor BofA family protein n=1 Tax=Candidatus Mediterraneibacter faecavium TaxID=2838668 RepID=A0A9D2Q9J9_9FIRM|nr:pro-sigmaK processing inhibitor BofA family protein [Candidatus Mediterraneibacter faecavium]
MTGKGADHLGKKIISAAVQFFIRAVVGMALIFFINQYVIPPDSSINVGMNAVSFLTSGTLGIPGVGLLYGIMCYQIL